MMRQARPDDRELLRPLGHSPGDIDFISIPPGRGALPPVTIVWEASDGALLGSASALPLPGFPGLWLTGYVRVLPEARGAGIGKALVRAAAAAARSAGALRAFCTIEPDNLSSIAIHLREGYRALPVARSSVPRPATTGGSRENAVPVRLSRLDPQASLAELVGAAGIDALVRLPPGQRPVLGLLGPLPPAPGPRGWLSRLRGHRSETLWRVDRGDDTPLGLLVTAPGEQRLALTRAALQDATPGLLAKVWAAGQTESGTGESGDLALYHDAGVPPPPGLVERTHVFYAVEFTPGEPRAGSPS